MDRVTSSESAFLRSIADLASRQDGKNFFQPVEVAVTRSGQEIESDDEITVLAPKTPLRLGQLCAQTLIANKDRLPPGYRVSGTAADETILREAKSFEDWLAICTEAHCDRATIAPAASEVLSKNGIDVQGEPAVDELLGRVFDEVIYRHTPTEGNRAMRAAIAGYSATLPARMVVPQQAKSFAQSVLYGLTLSTSSCLFKVGVGVLVFSFAHRGLLRGIEFVRVEVIPRAVVKICQWVPGKVVHYTGLLYRHTFLVWMGSLVVGLWCPRARPVTNRINRVAYEIIWLPFNLWWMPLKWSLKAAGFAFIGTHRASTWANKHVHHMINRTEEELVQQARAKFIEIAKREMGLSVLLEIGGRRIITNTVERIVEEAKNPPEGAQVFIYHGAGTHTSVQRDPLDAKFLSQCAALQQPEGLDTPQGVFSFLQRLALATYVRSQPEEGTTGVDEIWCYDDEDALRSRLPLNTKLLHVVDTKGQTTTLTVGDLMSRIG